MALDENGLVIDRFPEHLEDLEESLRNEFGNTIDLTENSVLGILNRIYAFSLSQQSELQQSVYDSFILDTAEGKQLDDLVALVGMSRRGASPSTGNVIFTVDSENTIIPEGTIVSNNDGLEFLTVNQDVASLSNTTKATLQPNTIQGGGATYSITIEQQIFNAPVTGSPQTNADVVVSVVNYINSNKTSDLFDAIDNLDGTFTIQSSTLVDEINIVKGSKFDTVSLEVTSLVASRLTGPIQALAGTITTIGTPVLGVSSVINLVDTVSGRDIETDEELRQRHALEVGTSGTATVPNIERRVRDVPNVLGVTIFENRSHLFDSEGRPPKSFEVVVQGGDNDVIAQTIWETKPAGIETVGNESVLIVDSNNAFQEINFSRPESVFIIVRVEYSLYDEEVFPEDGDDSIANIIKDTGNELGVGVDVIPQRFFGPIYAAVSGIQGMEIKLSYALTPEGSAETILQQVTIPISLKQIAAFDSNRIEVVRV